VKAGTLNLQLKLPNELLVRLPVMQPGIRLPPNANVISVLKSYPVPEAVIRLFTNPLVGTSVRDGGSTVKFTVALFTPSVAFTE
jgi:hypothetical protein